MSFHRRLPQQSEFIELTVETPSSSVKGAATPIPVAELSLGSGVVLRVFTPGDSRE